MLLPSGPDKIHSMTPHGTQSSSPTDKASIPYPNAHCKLFFQTCHGDGSTGLKKAVRLEWKKVNGVSGYDIQYTSEDHQAGSGFVVSYPTQTQYTLSNLAAGKTYTFNIRTFVTVGGQNYNSPWSRAIKVKTK